MSHLEPLPIETNSKGQTVQNYRWVGKINAQKLLCSWGMHFHNKTIMLCSDDNSLKFSVKICPHCKCPSKKTIKQIFGDGNIRLNTDTINMILSLCELLTHDMLWDMISKAHKGENYRLPERYIKLAEDIKKVLSK